MSFAMNNHALCSTKRRGAAAGWRVPQRQALISLAPLALALAPAACNRRAPLPPGAVVFQGAGVALVPGQHWKTVQR